MANSYGFDTAAWSIDGARHNGDLLRVLAYAATNGSEGVVSVGDCKVHQLSVPGTQIVIDSGAVLVRNRSGSTKNQTYVANGRTETRLDVTPTTSAGGRSDAVIVRLEDPQFSPWTKPSAAAAPLYRYTKPFIVENVPASTTNADQLGLGYSAYMLARLDIPSSTATITDGMITNVRKVANPRSLRRHVRANHQGAAYDLGGNGATWENWPPVARAIEIPTWATEMIVRMDITGGSAVGGPVGGYMRGVYSVFNGPVINATAQTTFSVEESTQQRRDFLVSDQIPVPASARGTTMYFYPQGRKFVDVGGVGILRADTGTSVVFDVEFLETAV